MLGIPLRAGRVFEPTDTADTPRVVVVNEAMARRHWPGEDPVGARIRLWFGGPPTDAEVIGVVGDVRDALQADPQPSLFVAHAQQPTGAFHFTVRADGDPSALVRAVQDEIWAMNPAMPFAQVTTLEGLFDDSLRDRRSMLQLVIAFSVTALALAAIGAYGLVSHESNRRSHEIGIRVAIGASRRRVLALVVGDGLKLALLGIGVGAVLAVARRARAAGLSVRRERVRSRHVGRYRVGDARGDDARELAAGVARGARRPHRSLGPEDRSDNMPNWTKELESRLASLRSTPAREAEIVEELSEHLEQRYAELRDQGVDEAEAFALVRAELLDDKSLAEFMRPLRQANAPPPPGPVGAPRAAVHCRRASHAHHRLLRFRRPRSAPRAARLAAAARLHVRRRAHARARHRRDDGDLQRRLLGADQAAAVSERRRARADQAHRSRASTSSTSVASRTMYLTYRDENRTFAASACGRRSPRR